MISTCWKKINKIISLQIRKVGKMNQWLECMIHLQDSKNFHRHICISFLKQYFIKCTLIKLNSPGLPKWGLFSIVSVVTKYTKTALYSERLCSCLCGIIWRLTPRALQSPNLPLTHSIQSHHPWRQVSELSACIHKTLLTWGVIWEGKHFNTLWYVLSSHYIFGLADIVSRRFICLTSQLSLVYAALVMLQS